MPRVSRRRPSPTAPSPVGDHCRRPPRRRRRRGPDHLRNGRITDPVLLDSCILDLAITADASFVTGAIGAQSSTSQHDSTYVVGDLLTGVIEAAGGEDVYTFVVPSGGMEVFADVVCFWQERLEILDVSGAVVKTGCNKQTHSLAAGSYTLRTFSVTRDFGAYRLIRAQS